MSVRFPHLSIQPNLDFIDEVFLFDVKTLGSTSSALLGQYIVALSQYLVYLHSEINRLKAAIIKKKRFLETTVGQLLTKELLKEYTAKKDATAFLITTNPELLEAQTAMEALQDELYLLEGSDKSLAELVASFKRELTRREHEKQFAKT